ncbi:MAG: hypothetical protein KKB03_02325 [Nanoarchaeota archaeon]|nr:hypothetical protein [Nanoarchaeota archaeon]
MEKKDIIKIFMEKGVLLSPQELKEIDEYNYEEILSKHIKPEEDKTIKYNKEEENKLEITTKPITKEQIEIIIKNFKKKKQVIPKDFIDYYNKKYEGIRNILTKKLNATSINKAMDISSTSNIIGVVKQRAQNGFVLEDQTGSIEIISKDDPPIGDILSVTGSSREGKFFEKEIVYPDIPLTHRINSLKGEITLEKQDGKINVISSAVTKETTTPSHIRIKKGDREVLVFIYEPIEPIRQDHVVELLKKRHLSPKISEILYDDDPFIIEPVPDVVVLFGGEEYVKNYKGVTVVSTGSRATKIDLETKKVEFVD